MISWVETKLSNVPVSVRPSALIKRLARLSLMMTLPYIHWIMAGTPFATNHTCIVAATVMAEPTMICFADSGSLDHRLRTCRSGSDGSDFPVPCGISCPVFLAAFQITSLVSCCKLRDLKVNSLPFDLVRKTTVRSIHGRIHRGWSGWEIVGTHP